MKRRRVVGKGTGMGLIVAMGPSAGPRGAEIGAGRVSAGRRSFSPRIASAIYHPWDRKMWKDRPLRVRFGMTAGAISSRLVCEPHGRATMRLGAKVFVRRTFVVGFVGRVVPNGTYETEALAMAGRLVDLARLVIGVLKRPVSCRLARSSVWWGQRDYHQGTAGRRPSGGYLCL
jgi:hypothetical protein